MSRSQDSNADSGTLRDNGLAENAIGKEICFSGIYLECLVGNFMSNYNIILGLVIVSNFVGVKFVLVLSKNHESLLRVRS